MQPQILDATRHLSVGAELGEGPIWIDGALWFVDIKGKAIYRQDPTSGALDKWDAPDFVGWIVPSANAGMLVGMQSGPHRFDPASGKYEPIAEVDPHLPDNRLNDAAVDPAGRVWFGTMDNLESDKTGKVYVLDRGEVRESAIQPITITNGPAVHPLGTHLYHVDTIGRRIIRHAISGDGHVEPGELFLEFTGDEGHPDGAICDAQGGVWIAFFGGAAVRRYAPDGTLTDVVRFPVSNVTKIAIGGKDGLTAYATTAKQGLTETELSNQPMAGDIFTFPVRVPAAPLNKANT